MEKEWARVNREIAELNKDKYRTLGKPQLKIGSKGGIGITQKIVVNTKTAKLLAKVGTSPETIKKIMKAVGIVTIGGWAVSQIMESIGLSLWSKGEAKEIAGFVLWPAYKLGEETGNWSAFNQSVELADSIQGTLKGDYAPWGVLKNIPLKIDTLDTAKDILTLIGQQTQEEQISQEGVAAAEADRIRNDNILREEAERELELERQTAREGRTAEEIQENRFGEGDELYSPEEKLIQEKSFSRAEEKQTRIKADKPRTQEAADARALRERKSKDSASVGPQALRTFEKPKKRRQSSL